MAYMFDERRPKPLPKLKEGWTWSRVGWLVFQAAIAGGCFRIYCFVAADDPQHAAGILVFGLIYGLILAAFLSWLIVGVFDWTRRLFDGLHDAFQFWRRDQAESQRECGATRGADRLTRDPGQQAGS